MHLRINYRTKKPFKLKNWQFFQSLYLFRKLLVFFSFAFFIILFCRVFTQLILSPFFFSFSIFSSIFSYKMPFCMSSLLFMQCIFNFFCWRFLLTLQVLFYVDGLFQFFATIHVFLQHWKSIATNKYSFVHGFS